MFVNKRFIYLGCVYLTKQTVLQCKTFGILFLWEDEDISRFSYLHLYTFNNFLQFFVFLCFIIVTRKEDLFLCNCGCIRHYIFIFFFRLSKVWNMLHHGSMRQVQNKINNALIYFQVLFSQILFFFIIKFVFIIMYALNKAYFLRGGNVSQTV